MKKLVLILMLLILSGCSSEYTLEISNDVFKEKINVVIDNNEIPNNSYSEEIETDDQITPFIEKEYSAFFTNKDKNYKKNVKKTTEYTNVEMSYEYNEDNFVDSYSLNSCVEDFEFVNGENYFIHAYGYFYCLYSDSININIKTNNKVLEHNADSVNGNVYTWNINEMNKNNVNIRFEVVKGLPYKIIKKYSITIITLLSIIGIICYKILRSNKKNNKI